MMLVPLSVASLGTGLLQGAAEWYARRGGSVCEGEGEDRCAPGLVVPG